MQLSRDDVHVWPILLGGYEPVCQDVLSDDERRRAQRLVYPWHRGRFVQSRIVLRSVLATYMDTTPSDIEFTQGSHGKPALRSHDELHFNLSHCRDRALLAVAMHRRVGVDIEATDHDNVLPLARRFFAQAECDVLASMASAAQSVAFARCWTRKESFVKATGEGLSRDLDTFEVSLETEGRQLLLRDSSSGTSWRTVNLSTPEGYAAALTAEGLDWTAVEMKRPVTAAHCYLHARV